MIDDPVFWKNWREIRAEDALAGRVQPVAAPAARVVAAFGYCLLGGATVAVVATVYIVRHVMRSHC